MITLTLFFLFLLEGHHQARNQLGTPGGEEFFQKGPNFLNYVEPISPGVSKNFAAPPLRPPWL